METQIYLIRHSQTTGNTEKRLAGRTDFVITPEGQKYIDLLTSKLKKVHFDVAYSSTSKRTYNTILKLAQINNLRIIEDEQLCEMSFGIYDGMTWEEVNKINPQIDVLHKQTNEIMMIPNQESSFEVADRMYNEILKIAMKNIGKTILICSHGVAIEAFLRKISGVPFTEKVQEYSQKNTAINILKFHNESKTFELIKLNDYSHLAER